MSKVEEAKRWLRDVLSEGAAPAADVLALAGSDGFSGKTLQRAAAALGVERRKVGRPGGGDQRWLWELGISGGDGGHLDAFQVLSSLVLEDGSEWGAVADDVQLEDARQVLTPDSATPYSFETRSRGRAKTSDAAGLAVALLLTQAPPQSRSYYLAADRDQGRLAIDSIAGYVSRTPDLAGHLDVEQWKVTARQSGATLEILAADTASAFGLRPYFLVIDEVSVWAETEGPRRLFDAVTSALVKVPGARCLVITSAGSPSHWSYRRLEHARKDPLWRTHEVEGVAAWADPERLAEQKRRLLPSMYTRLFENVWCESEDALATRADVEACVQHDGDLAPDSKYRYTAALDVGLVRDRCVACVAHTEERPAGRTVVLDRLAVWQGRRAAPVDLSAVEAWIREACTTYRCGLVYDPFQAAHLSQRLQKAHIRAEAFTFSSASVGKLASTLFGLLKDHCLDLPSDDALVDELCSVKLRETSPGVVRLDHSGSGHDDRAVTIAMASHHLIERPAGSAGSGWASHGPVVAASSHLVPQTNPLARNMWREDETKRSGWWRA